MAAEGAHRARAALYLPGLARGDDDAPGLRGGGGAGAHRAGQEGGGVPAREPVREATGDDGDVGGLRRWFSATLRSVCETLLLDRWPTSRLTVGLAADGLLGAMNAAYKVVQVGCLILATSALLVIAGFAIVYAPRWHSVDFGPSSATADFSRTDFITIILTALAVILAALGLVVAIAGAVGYVTVRGAAEKIAREAAEDVAARVATVIAATRAEAVAAERAEDVATRVAREIAMQIAQGGGLGSDDAFAEAEGKK